MTVRGLIPAILVRGASGFLLMALMALMAMMGSAALEAATASEDGQAPTASTLSGHSGRSGRSDRPSGSSPESRTAASHEREHAHQSSAPPSASHGPGVYHRVQPQQTLFRISRMYGVSLDALMRANGITDASRVQSGQVLRIPGVAAPQAARVPEHPASPRRSSQARALRAPQKGVLSAVEAGLASRSGPELPGPDQAPMGVSFIILPPSEPFSWPVEGGQTRSGFGMRGSRLHAGLDISAPVGSDVRAARSGTVVYSGHKYAGYGNVVMIDHGDGYMTVYAHNSRNLVSAGDTVARGETIAEVGATGNATGSHCHFEIRKGQAAVDPMRFFNQSRDESHVALGSAPAREPARMDQAATLGTQDPTP